MAWLQQLWQEAQHVLRDMSMVQRVVVSLFIATLAMLLTFSVWVGSEKTDPGKVPVAGYVDAADYQAVLDQLKNQGFDAEYDAKNGRVKVPMDQSERAYLFLVSNKLVKEPHNYGFEEMLKNWSFADSRNKTNEMTRVARESVMSRVIEKIDLIQEAQVVYSDTGRSTLFTGPYPTSAMVRVKTKLGKDLTDEVAQSIIQVVASSKAGLLPKNITVIDQTTGASHRAEEGNSPGVLGKNKIEIQNRLNAEKRRPIEEMIFRAVGMDLSASGGVWVNVNHEIDADYKVVFQHDILEGQASQIHQRKFESSSTDRPAAEPGAKPNVLTARQMSDNIGGGRITEQRTSEKDARKIMENGKRQTVTKPVWKVLDRMVSVVINLPFVLEYDEQGHPVPMTSPDGRTLVDPGNGGIYWKRKTAPPISDDRLTNIAKNIAKVVGIEDENIPEKINIIQVDWQPPVLPILPPATDVEGMLAQAKQYVMPAVLVLIFMGMAAFLWSETRKHRPIQADEEVEEEEITVALAPPMTVDDAAEAEMEATRLRVQEAVLENPERAASLVRRWMSKDV